MHQFTFILGDNSRDGHGITSCYPIESNLSAKEVVDYYQKGVTLIGFDLIEQVASEYEQSFMTEEQVLLLKKHGYPVRNLQDWEEYNFMEAEDEHEEEYLDALHLQIEEYIALYRFFVETGYRSEHEQPLHFELVVDDMASIDIGGYGFFR